VRTTRTSARSVRGQRVSSLEVHVERSSELRDSRRSCTGARVYDGSSYRRRRLAVTLFGDMNDMQRMRPAGDRPAACSRSRASLPPRRTVTLLDSGGLA
jgi:hypothetical protein